MGNSKLYIADVFAQRREVSVATVSERMKLYTKREVSQAVKARQLQRRLGFINKDTLLKMISNGTLLHCDISKKDVLRAEHIFGQDIGEIKGKATSRKAPEVRPDEKIHKYNIQVEEQVCHTDIMFVRSKPFLITVFTTTDYVMVTRIKSRGAKDILNALKKHVSEMEKQGFKVRLINTDGESGLVTDADNVFELNRLGYNVDVVGAGEPVPVVERKIRTIKERARCLASTLPFELSSKLEDLLVLWATNRVNLQVSTNSTEYTCPKEKVYNTKTDVKREAKHCFGEYVQVYNTEMDNSLKERARGAICIMPTGYYDNSWYYLTLDNEGLVRRVRATSLPMPDEVIKRLNDLAERDNAEMKRSGRSKIKNMRNAWEITNYEADYSAEDDVVDDGAVVADTVVEMNEPTWDIYNGDIESELEAADTEVSDIGASQSTAEVVQQQQALVEPTVDTSNGSQENEHDEILANNIADVIEYVSDNFMVQDDNRSSSLSSEGYEVTESVVNTTQPVDTQTVQDNVQPRTSRWEGVLRPNRVPPGTYNKRDYGTFKKIYGKRVVSAIKKALSQTQKSTDKNLNIKSAVDKLGEKAVDAIMKEMNTIVKDKEVFEPVDTSVLSRDQWRSIIPSKLFIKEKYNALGVFEKVKARLVAGGHRQDKEVFENISSSTVSTAAVMMVACIAAAENRSVAVIDFPSAYLNSPLPEDHPEVLMRLDRELSKYTCSINPIYSKYIRDDGTLVVRLRKALYGCVQSAKVWYDLLTSQLCTLGYKINEQDNCVLNKYDDGGKQITIVVHVDDILMTASSDEVLHKEISKIKDVFGELSVNYGPIVNYLGMTFDYSAKRGAVKVTMEGFIDEFIKDMDGKIDGVSRTPASRNLFEIGNSKLLDKDQKEFFHSTVARLLYLAKRVRPDLLLAISYLAKRVQQPNETDYIKLCKLIKYLRSTKQLGIVLDGNKQIMILAYIDASHAIHDDCKSHTGVVISMGKGPIYIKSTSQKINTRSSTESELVALSDSITQVIWARNFLLQQGYKIQPGKVYQDNKSTMALVKNGKSNSERTKHIAARFYFVKDRVEAGDIQIEYMSTENMIADIMTKPLNGAAFERMRNLLLNI